MQESHIVMRGSLWIGGARKRWLLRLLLVFACGGLAACSTPAPQPASTAFEMPEVFVASGAGSGPAELAEPWWQTFGDAHLNAFVEHALLGNPALAQALARMRLAEAQTRMQRGERLPQVGINFDAVRQKQNFFFETDEESFRFNLLETRHTAALGVSWELDVWGRLAALSASARADFLASQQQLRAVQQSLAAQVVQMYFGIVHAQAQVELAQSTVSSLAEMARHVGNRVREGVASPADGLLAQANLDSARAGLQQRLDLLARSQRQLEVAMGQYPAGRLATAVVLPPLPPTPSAGLPAELLQRRPDVRAAELGLLSAGYQLGAAQRSFLPSLSLNGSAGYSSNQLAGLFSSGNLIWSIAGSVMQPVFQGGRLVAQVDIAGAQRDEALLAYGETALNALAEVETALAVEQVLQQREEALAESAQAAQEAQRVSLNRYLQGIEPFLMVLESQQRALEGRSAHLSAHLERLDNRIALYLALGGGFEDAASAGRFSSLATQTPVQETHDE